MAQHVQQKKVTQKIRLKILLNVIIKHTEKHLKSQREAFYNLLTQYHRMYTVGPRVEPDDVKRYCFSQEFYIYGFLRVYCS